jgi:nitrate/nitrite-specific signal transduction histidine kinase
MVAKQFAKGEFEERIEITEDSEEEIAELATAFNNMAYSLKHLEEIRSSFVANVSTTSGRP